MHCYKIIIIIKIQLQKLKYICHPFNYFCLTKFCFFLNKWHYRILLIQLLKILYPPQRIKKKKKIVKYHSLTSKLITIDNQTWATNFLSIMLVAIANIQGAYLEKVNVWGPNFLVKLEFKIHFLMAGWNQWT